VLSVNIIITFFPQSNKHQQKYSGYFFVKVKFIEGKLVFFQTNDNVSSACEGFVINGLIYFDLKFRVICRKINEGKVWTFGEDSELGESVMSVYNQMTPSAWTHLMTHPSRV